LFLIHQSVSLSISIDRKKVLGKGAYGIVYEGTWRDRKVAVKRIQIENVENNKGEVEALQKLDHPNVVKLYHVESDSDFRCIKFTSGKKNKNSNILF
jgi:serine/threonine protein kinase